MTRDFLWDFSFKLDNTGICTVSAKLYNFSTYLEIYLDDFSWQFFKVLAFFQTFGLFINFGAFFQKFFQLLS